MCRGTAEVADVGEVGLNRGTDVQRNVVLSELLIDVGRETRLRVHLRHQFLPRSLLVILEHPAARAACHL